jgi:ABC-type lipoprotein export system ATPase subunit
VLDLVGLDRAARQPLPSLPPGQLQLAALAVALASRPGLLLGDEPTSQLHHTSRDVVLDALHRVNQEWGTTIVVVTHDPEVAARLPRTVTIRDGRVGGEGRAGEEYAVVAADGSLPLPPAAVAAFPPGALVRVHETEDGVWTLVPETIGEGGEERRG